jgi:hypothetical protein
MGYFESSWVMSVQVRVESDRVSVGSCRIRIGILLLLFFFYLIRLKLGQRYFDLNRSKRAMG